MSRPRLSAGWVAVCVRLVVMGVAVLWLWCPDAAARTGSPPVLDWDAPAACPDASVVVERLRAVWEAAGDVSDAAGRVRGRVTAQSSQWLLQLEITDGGQRFARVIRARRCEDLGEAAAIAIALAFGREVPLAEEPLAATRAARPTQRKPEPVARGASSTDAPLDADSGSSWLSQLGFSVAAGATLDVNTLPEPSPGVSLEVRARQERVEVGVYGMVSSGAEVSLGGGGAVDFGLLAAGARGCYLPWNRAASAAACLGVEAGQFRANGVGLSTSRSVVDGWFAPNASLELGAQLGAALQARMRTEALVPLIRKHYVVDGIEPVYQPPSFALRFYVGLQLATD